MRIFRLALVRAVGAAKSLTKNNNAGQMPIAIPSQALLMPASNKPIIVWMETKLKRVKYKLIYKDWSSLNAPELTWLFEYLFEVQCLFFLLVRQHEGL